MSRDSRCSHSALFLVYTPRAGSSVRDLKVGVLVLIGLVEEALTRIEISMCLLRSEPPNKIQCWARMQNPCRHLSSTTQIRSAVLFRKRRGNLNHDKRVSCASRVVLVPLYSGSIIHSNIALTAGYRY